jgi:hypothetical protein
MIMNGKEIRIWKEAFETCSKKLSLQKAGKTEKTREIFQSGYLAYIRVGQPSNKNLTNLTFLVNTKCVHRLGDNLSLLEMYISTCPFFTFSLRPSPGAKAVVA